MNKIDRASSFNTLRYMLIDEYLTAGYVSGADVLEIKIISFILVFRSFLSLYLPTF